MKKAAQGASGENFVRLNLKNSQGSNKHRSAHSKSAREKRNAIRFKQNRESYIFGNHTNNDNNYNSNDSNKNPIQLCATANVDPIDDHFENTLGTTKSKVPKCIRHNRPCVKRTIKHNKKGNKGKSYYTCSLPRDQACPFFLWADDTEFGGLGKLSTEDTYTGFVQRQCLLHRQKYGGWNLGELRTECAMRGLEIGGKKGELVMRLVVWCRKELVDAENAMSRDDGNVDKSNNDSEGGETTLTKDDQRNSLEKRNSDVNKGERDLEAAKSTLTKDDQRNSLDKNDKDGVNHQRKSLDKNSKDVNEGERDSEAAQTTLTKDDQRNSLDKNSNSLDKNRKDVDEGGLDSEGAETTITKDDQRNSLDMNSNNTASNQIDCDQQDTISLEDDDSQSSSSEESVDTTDEEEELEFTTQSKPLFSLPPPNPSLTTASPTPPNTLTSSTTTTIPTQSQILAVLQSQFHHTTFRPGQLWAISRILSPKPTRSLLIAPTVLGKSLCYALPTLLHTGLTLVISPLLSLIKDQMRHLPPSLPSATLSGNSSYPTSTLLRDITAGRIRILYLSPEKLCSSSFRRLLPRLRIQLLVVDEAHCMSLWGHHFRPSFLRMRGLLQGKHGGNAVLNPENVLALTATAGQEVVTDVCGVLGIDPRMDDTDETENGVDATKFNSLEPNTGGVKILSVHRDNIDVKAFLFDNPHVRLDTVS